MFFLVVAPPAEIDNFILQANPVAAISLNVHGAN
jgi:hypothetical protein